MKAAFASGTSPISARNRAKWVRPIMPRLSAYLSAPSKAPSIPTSASSPAMRSALPIRPLRTEASPPRRVASEGSMRSPTTCTVAPRQVTEISTPSMNSMPAARRRRPCRSEPAGFVVVGQREHPHAVRSRSRDDRFRVQRSVRDRRMAMKIDVGDVAHADRIREGASTGNLCARKSSIRRATRSGWS